MHEDLKNYKIKEVPHLRISGRTDRERDDVPLFYNGSGIEVNVSGCEFWITVEAGYEIFEPWACTMINGAVIERFGLKKGTNHICIFRGMSRENIKNIRFIRETQAMSDDPDCYVLVKEISADGEFFELKKPKYKLEFIGDSLTSGEGTYGANDDMDWLPMYMSFSHQYAHFIEETADCEVRMISQGGWGVYNAWDNNRNNVIPGIYKKICALTELGKNREFGSGKEYDFSSWVPDAVIVNLGTNDASGFKQPPFKDQKTGTIWKQRLEDDGSYNREDIGCFKKAVKDFLIMLRECNPTSHIVWVYGMLGHDIEEDLKDAVGEYCRENSDDNAAYLSLPDTLPEKLGSRQHSGVAAHRDAARIILSYLEKVL